MGNRHRAISPSRGSVLVVATALILVTMVATKARAAEDLCPNAEVRVGKSADLPRCRAYEQVTPVEKGYGVFNGNPPFTFAARDGGAVAYSTSGPLPGSESGSISDVYLSQRQAGEWKLTPLIPPQTPIPGHTTFPFTQGFSEDLLHNALVTANPPLSPGADPDVANLYVRETGPEAWRLISTTQTPENYRWTLRFDGASKDFSHVVFDTYEPLLPGVTGPSVYENFNGELRNVAILPNGEPAPSAIFVGQGSARGFHGVSDDGSRIYFISTDGNIYVRKDATSTVAIADSQRTVPDPNSPLGSPATFWSATVDGNTAFFTTALALTNDANTGTDSEGNPTDAGANLYAFDLETEKLTDLSVDSNPADTAGADVLGVVGSADDGSSVYFVARGDLAGAATSGSPNLYLWHEGSVHFIATLAEGDTGNWASFLPEVTSEVTPDGSRLLLSSAARLTSYDNTDAVSGEPDTEVYLYSADEDRLACVSCRPEGVAPTSSTSIAPSHTIINPTRYERRYITDDGNQVVFDTTEPLVSRDTNGQRDVYEFDDGGLHLLSTGSSEFESAFGDMSADGSDVFIETQERLLPSDVDGYADLYDVRVGGGFPEAPAPVPPCAGGECQRSASSPPSASFFGSNAFAGPGNVKSHRRCRKGTHLVRRHGKARCERKRHKVHHRKQRRAGSTGEGGK
jgi:hypothetical protein